MVTVDIENPRQPGVPALLAEGDRFALALYPVENCHGLDIDSLERPNVVLYVAREDGVAIGTAALQDRGDGSAELKRMFVTGAARGRGIGRALLDAIEAHARRVGISLIQLETGLPQVDAIGLYERSGYEQIPRFGAYTNDSTSYCMEKAI
ncbi:GNAT family N-acetyltransferase [Plantibacter sp. Mn2098]|uniref:GNAT family N-acetyltransferase n=1 Tax=Plantibacter sp. Mn2098 TaxID=3395266 RepID=UPI003BEB86D4